MNTPPKPPERIVFFINRSLGRKIIPEALRQVGKEIAESRLGRPATWREVLMEYKSYRGKPNAKGMRIFAHFGDGGHSNRSKAAS